MKTFLTSILLAAFAAAAAHASLVRRNSAIPAESSCNKVFGRDACLVAKDAMGVPCEWCVAGAIPSECMSREQAELLPADVFACQAPGTAVLRGQSELYGSFEAAMNARETKNDFCDDSSKSISGYVDISKSQYDADGEDKHLFFWMFEKRGNKTEETPLIVWLTGGPGCSSTLALLTENGPCKVNDDGETTRTNPHSWTEAAHVLWLDQPAGVGFSYGSETDSNEEMISEDAYWFLQTFFQTFPEYQKSPLFIVGESYGGHYAPAIAHRTWLGNKQLQKNAIHLNLSGLGIGNGLTNPEEQYKWYPEMVYNNSHHIQVVSEEVYNGMLAVVPKCTALIAKCNQGNSLIDTFACQSAFLACNLGLTSPYQSTGLNPYDIRIKCEEPPLCYDMSHIEKWLNLETTKKALNIDEKHSHAWRTCNFGINMQFRTDWMKDFSGYVADLVNDGIPALIYAGDVDFICNYLGNRAWTLKLDWTGSSDFVGAGDHDWKNGKGLARSAHGLTFLQVYDAGHMVPSDQPEVALTMIRDFVNGATF